MGEKLELVLVDEYLISREAVIGYLTPLESTDNSEASSSVSLCYCVEAATLQHFTCIALLYFLPKIIFKPILVCLKF